MSSQAYLDKWSNYGRKDVKWEDYSARDITDFRKRVRRETVRGKTTFLHESMEDYIVRQLRAYTPIRAVLLWSFFVSATAKSKV